MCVLIIKRELKQNSSNQSSIFKGLVMHGISNNRRKTTAVVGVRTKNATRKDNQTSHGINKSGKVKIKEINNKTEDGIKQIAERMGIHKK